MTRIQSSLRRWCCLAVVTGVMAPAAVAPSSAVGLPLAQSDPVTGVDDLWKEYPLDPDGADPGAAGPTPSDTPDAAAAGRGPGAIDDPADDQSPAATSPPTAGGGSVPVVPILVGLAAVAVVSILAVAVGRGRRPEPLAMANASSAAPRPDIVEVRHRVYVEGSTSRDGIGHFAGFVHATVVDDEPTSDSLCIGEPGSEAALWVRRSEITTMRAPQVDGVEDGGTSSGRFQRPAGTPSSSARA